MAWDVHIYARFMPTKIPMPLGGGKILTLKLSPRSKFYPTHVSGKDEAG
jgi:hypothetical protein